MDLIIKDLPKQSKKWIDKTPPTLPIKKYQLGLVIAKRGSGKSHMLNYMLIEQGLAKLYTRVLVLCPSGDPTWDHLVNYGGKHPELTIQVSKICSEAVLQRVFEQQQQFALQSESASKPNDLLLICDDAAFNARKASDGWARMLEKIASNGRHALISLIVCCQNYNQAPPVCRTNADIFWLFKQPPRKFLDIAEEISNLDPKVFQKRAMEMTEKPHSFMLVDRNRNEIHQGGPGGN